MDYLPLFTRVAGADCLVVGGGTVALRKAGALERAGARVTAVAPEVADSLKSLCLNSGGRVIERGFQANDLDGVMLVIAATDDESVNRAVSDAARQRNVLVNVVDQPELCSVILPSIVDRSPLIIAVSSGGRSPVLARLLRARLESVIPASYGKLTELVGDFRDKVRQRIPDFNQRRDFWEHILQGPVAELVFAGRKQAATEMLEDELQTAKPAPRGEVYLVGAGPGDPDLLTFKALRLMQKADVVLHDRLVAKQIVDLCRKDAEYIYVGKARSNHTMPQDDINALLIKLAKEGKRVLRLKGGDPFIFGRGGEELAGLAEERIPFQVVPGITAAAGCASYSGIPLTHRDYAQSVRFMTGHLKDNTMNLPWQELVHKQQTIVFYMGLQGLSIICREMMAHGREPDTPMALVQQGTTPNHKVLVGTLATMPELVAREEVAAPTLIIVGEVVKLREQLAWFENPQQEAVLTEPPEQDNP
ncbi:uroporphyrin-III C-methyltransferase/precorrin-2 dehydrogenase/sirohydrochlorin ferrochelatase [Litorivivens lipolytica]|uniref:Siroheme synthase n=1 Tax=Litorivivens lipolytica TaxID=1524264 RepID=A0A7W4W3C4_9GAMM|nr:siroheme synthase CysG [Litorivivens lipolytica]MBB3046393.1 uroporphyrin-III C-methyltransferase/precorrin-2 dehydrogenase/sirohydrochlorin ferrochelatase [Litorivivens lipolytica]